MNSEDYGWTPEVSNWYNQALDEKNNPNAEIWSILAQPENTFQAASWWLARKVIQDSMNFEIGYRKQIKHLVSREETQGSFPFTQYIRELCQNALDSIMNDEHLTIELFIDESGMKFSHDGRTFRGPTPTSPEGEMASLYAPGMTTKRGSFNSEGRFGIGFKGWMLFFEGIRHEHSNGHQKIQVGYQFEGDGYNRESLFLKGPDDPINNVPGPRRTSFNFSYPTLEFQAPSIEEIIDEWSPMIRFAHHGVTIKINVMGDEVELIHEVNTLQNLDHSTLGQEIFESFTRVELTSYQTAQQFICTHTGCEQTPFTPACPLCDQLQTVEEIPIEDSENFHYRCTNNDCDQFSLSIPDCPVCKDDNDVVPISRLTEERIVGLRSQIVESEEINNAINAYIDGEKAHYSSLQNQELNPWLTVEPADWYSEKRITLGISLTDKLDVSPWLFSMAEITSSVSWPENIFYSQSNWIVDGPFLLSPTRKELKNDEISDKANASMLQFVLSECTPKLAEHLFQNGNLKGLNQSSPFDIMFNSETKSPATNPFHGVIFQALENKELDWNVEPREYSQIFNGRPIYSNVNNQMINTNLIRRIPGSWEIGGGLTLCEWLQDRTETMTLHFDFVPYSNSSEISEILNEKNTPMTWTIPEIEKNRLYDILTEAELIEELVNDFPGVVHAKWFQMPIEDGITCFIFGQRPNQSELLTPIQDYVFDSGLRFIDVNDKLAHKYNQKKPKWIEFNGYNCLSVPTEASPEWWFDVLMERILRDEIIIPNDVIESISNPLNNSNDCSFFVAKVKALYVYDGKGIRLSREELAILPRTFNYRSNWTVLTNTMTAWNLNREANSAGLSLWRGVSSDAHSQNIINDRIYLSRDNKSTDYLCEYDGHIIQLEQPLEGASRPVCPECSDASDVVRYDLFHFLKDRDYFAVMGEPINSSQIISFMGDVIEKSVTSFDSYNSAMLVVSPYPETEPILAQLRGKNWTKIPTFSTAKHRDALPDDFRYNDQGFFNQETGDNFLLSNWADTEESVNSEIALYYSTFYGHALKLHEKNRQNKQKNALIREIGVKELLLHSEWFGDDEAFQNLRLYSSINQNRIVQYNRLSVALVRVHRTGIRGKYSLKRASVRTTRQSTSNFDSQNLIPYEESQSLADIGLCGFSQTLLSEPIRWTISLCDIEEDAGEWDSLYHIDTLVIVPSIDIKVEVLPEDDKLRKGLCSGIHLLIDAIAQDDGNDIDLLLALAKIVRHIDSNLLGDSSVFKQMEEYNLGVQVEQKTRLLDYLDHALQEFENENEMIPLNALKSSLQGVQAQTWEAVEQAIGDLETDDEKWNFFISSRNLPTSPAVFQYRTNYQDFKRGPEHCRIGPNYAFTKEETARALFNINSQSTSEDAGAWTIPGGNHRVCIPPPSLVPILDCEAAAEHTIGDVNFEGVLTGAEKITDAVEIHPQWGFAQLLIGLRAAQLSNDSDFESFIPQIGQRETNHSCQVFSGKPILLGKGGWDICVESSEEGQSGLHLVTQNLQVSPKGTLLQLLKRILGVRLPELRRMSIENDESIELLASHFGIDGGELSTRIESLKRRMTGTILNPWNGNGEPSEAEKWDLTFGQKPEWQSDKNQAIERGTARRLLKRYTDAIRSLLNRGGLGAARNDDTQKLIRLLGNVRDDIKTTLYPNIGSLLVDEPIIYPPGEVITEMGNLRRKREATHAAMLEDSELKNFTGNLLFLSRFSTHRGTMYTNQFGLKERTDQTIQSTLHQILNHANAWGNEETVLLRDVMELGPRNYLSLRLHKYHAICMVALDDAFDTLLEEEE
jgi:hypothetical protein